MEPHDITTCTGCNSLLTFDELATYLRKSKDSLYKLSRRGYPAFPKAAKVSGGLLIRCTDAQGWILERVR